MLPYLRALNDIYFSVSRKQEGTPSFIALVGLTFMFYFCHHLHLPLNISICSTQPFLAHDGSSVRYRLPSSTLRPTNANLTGVAFDTYCRPSPQARSTAFDHACCLRAPARRLLSGKPLRHTRAHQAVAINSNTVGCQGSSQQRCAQTHYFSNTRYLDRLTAAHPTQSTKEQRTTCSCPQLEPHSHQQRAEASISNKPG